MECEDMNVEVKVIIVGNGGVGKSSMMRRFCKGDFTGVYKKTIGVEYMQRMVFVDEVGEDVELNIWDTAGQEEFAKLTRNYYAGASACVLAFSSTDRDSFEAVKKWKQQAADGINNDVAWVLVQNKADVMVHSPDDVVVTAEEGQALAKELGIQYFLTSVGRPKTDEPPMNVDKVFLHLAKEAYYLKQNPSPQPVAGSSAAAATAGVDAGPLVPNASGATGGGAAASAPVKLGAPSKQRTGGKKSGCC